MKKLKMHSKDIVQDNVSRIRDLFPDCVKKVLDPTTGQVHLSVDVEQLKEALGVENHVDLRGGGGVLSAGLARESGGNSTCKQTNVEHTPPKYFKECRF